MQDRRYTVWMPSEPPRTVFRSLARPANAEGLLHRRRGPPKRRTLSSVHRPRPHATGQVARRRGQSPRASTELFGRNGVGDDLPIEGLGVDGQERGRLAAVAADLAQGREDVLALHRLEASGRRRGRWRAGAQHFGGKIRGLDLVALAQDDRTLDGVEELANVARPGIRLERGERRGAEPLDAVRGVRLHEMIGEEPHVLSPLAQRRDLDGDRVDAVVEVLAELAGFHGLGEIAVRGGHEPYVDATRPGSADAKERAGLDGAQELHLAVRLHLADLVEQH